MFGSTQDFAMGGYGAGQTQTETQTEVSKKQFDRKPETLVPVTVRMIEKAVSESGNGDNIVRFHGEEVGAVLLVGAVEDLKKQQAAVEFVLNDASGKIRIRYFFQSGAADPGLQKLENGSYVKAIGVVKTEPSTLLSLVALHLVTSPDDIAFHAIEVAHTALRIQKGIGAQGVKTSVQSSMQVEMSGTPSPKGKAPQKPELSPDMSPPKAQLQGTELRDELQKYLQSEAANRPEGISLKVAVDRFHSSAGAADVKASIETLLEDGLAYTTVDEEHFAAI